MSLQWNIVAAFLYSEMAFIFLLVLPVISPKRWQKIFKSKFLEYIAWQVGLYFYVMIAILVLFLIDSIREIRKYSSEEESQHNKHLDAEMQGNMRLFRSQRNFYICGFALFLLVVIRRLVILISQQATLIAQAEANLRQAQSATSAARSLLAEKSDSEDQGKEIESLKSQITELENEIEKERKDKLAIKSQAENLNKEYDRLTDEHSKLQKKITVSAGQGDDKKYH